MLACSGIGVFGCQGVRVKEQSAFIESVGLLSLEFRPLTAVVYLLRRKKKKRTPIIRALPTPAMT